MRLRNTTATRTVLPINAAHFPPSNARTKDAVARIATNRGKITLAGRKRRQSRTPGSELDLLVAEKVMGWHGDGLKAAEVGALWCPSTNISAAWEVLDKFRQKGWAILLDHTPPKPVLFALQGPGREFAEVWAKTVPLAICRAALKVIDVGNFAP